MEVNWEQSDHELFNIAPEVIKESNRKIAFVCLDVDNSIENIAVEICGSGRKATVTVTPEDHIYLPSNVVGQRIRKGHVLHQNILNWRAALKSHKTTAISYKYVLDLPFKAKKKTLENFFVDSDGRDIKHRMYKKDAELTTNLYKSIFLVFEEDSDSNYYNVIKPQGRTVACFLEDDE